MAKKKPQAEYLSAPDDANLDALEEYLSGLNKPTEEKPEASSIARRALADSGIALLKGAISVPEAAVGLGSLVTGGAAGRMAEAAGFRPAEAKAMLDEYLSPEQKAANAAVQQAEGFTGKMGAALTNPSVIGQTVLESLPAMGAGGVAARGIMAAAPRVAPVVAGAAGEGITAAGMNAEQVRQDDPNGALTAGQAGIIAASGAATGGLSLLGGKIAQRLGIGDVDTLLAGAARTSGPQRLAAEQVQKGLVRKVLEGAVSEGLLEELPQSVQEQMATNYAEGKPLDEGVDYAAVMGILSGGLMGGAAGPFTGGVATVATPGDELRAGKIPEVGPMTRALNTAVEAAAQQADKGVPIPPEPGAQPAANPSGGDERDVAQGARKGEGRASQPIDFERVLHEMNLWAADEAQSMRQWGPKAAAPTARQPEPPADPTPEPTSAPMGDLLNPDGEPFKNRRAAEKARGSQPDPGAFDVVPVDGGFVVRPTQGFTTDGLPAGDGEPGDADAGAAPGDSGVGDQPAVVAADRAGDAGAPAVAAVAGGDADGVRPGGDPVPIAELKGQDEPQGQARPRLRGGADANLRGVAKHASEVPQQEQPSVQDARGERGDDLPAVDQRLQPVPEGRGREAISEALAGPDQERVGLPTGQRPLGNDERAAAQQNQQQASDAQRDDGASRGVVGADRNGKPADIGPTQQRMADSQGADATAKADPSNTWAALDPAQRQQALTAAGWSKGSKANDLMLGKAWEKMTDSQRTRIAAALEAATPPASEGQQGASDEGQERQDGQGGRRQEVLTAPGEVAVPSGSSAVASPAPSIKTAIEGAKRRLRETRNSISELEANPLMSSRAQRLSELKAKENAIEREIRELRARVFDEDADEDAAPAPKTDKAEIRPYRRPDGSIGYEAVPIAAPAPMQASTEGGSTSESDQDRSWREWRENYEQVVASEDLGKFTEGQIRRAINYGAKVASNLGPKAWDGDENAKKMIASYRREVELMEFHLKTRQKPAPASQPNPAPAPPAAPATGTDDEKRAWWERDLTAAGRRQALEQVNERPSRKGVLWKHLTDVEQAKLNGLRLKGFPNEDGQGDELDAEMRAYESKADAAAPAPAPSQPKTEGPKASANTVFTEDAAAAARARLKAKLGRLQSGLDPETMMDGITLAGYHIEKGARTFAAYARAMVDDLGDAVKPYLQSWYMAVRADPRAGAFKADMDKASAVEDVDVDAVLADSGTAAAPEQAQNETQENPDDPAPSTAQAPLDPPMDQGQRPAGSEQPARGARPPRARARRSDGGSVRGQGGLFEGGDDGRGDVGYGRGPDAVPGGPDDGVAGGVRGASPDYRPAIGGLTREGSWFDTAKRNLDLIDLARKIEEENRPATPEEQEQLAKYVGFGASEIRNNIFRVAHDYLRKQNPGRLIFPEMAVEARWKTLAERAAALPIEWQKTILQTTQYQHFTSEGIIRSIWSGVQRLGFTGGKVFEPGTGIGSFAMLMPESVRKTSKFTGIEFDAPTALIARLLSPQQNMLHDDFIKRKLPGNFFDVVVGNPPFSQTKILGDPDYEKHGFMLHDFFFAKAMDKLRPGGILTFVTSKGTMDKQSDKARKYLAARADLLGAIRLPSVAFEDNAGTSVVTDVIFLRKRLDGEQPAGMPWLGVKTIETKDGPAVVNEYFADHPDMVLGQQRISGNTDDEGRRINSNGMGGEKYTVVSYDKSLADLEAKFAGAIERLPENAYSPMTQGATSVRTEVAKMDFDPKVKREGVVYVKDGALMRVENGAGVPLDSGVKLSDRDRAWMTSYVGLRDLVQEARFAQATDGPWEQALKKLNAAYDKFVKDHGSVNAFRTQVRKSLDEDGNEVESTTRIFTNRRLFREDYDNPIVTQLEVIDEDGNIKKAPFLKDRTIGKPVTREVRTIGDALAVSLDETGRLDIDDVARRLNIGRDEAIDALGSQVYKTPQGEWQLADEYLSGDVVAKLAEATDAARLDESLRRNVEALKEVQPEKLGPSQISVKLGASWVSAEHVNDFAKEIEAGAVSFDPKTETWQVEGGNMRSQRKAGAEYGTADRSPSELLEAVLNSRAIKVIKRVDKKEVVDEEATTAANEAAKKIKEKFKTWVWTDTDRAADLVEAYNERFNNIAPRRFDGSHLTLPGVSLRYKLHPHQLRAIWRQIQTGNTYLAHAVGAGKTIEMIAGGMEQKRLGLIRKPMYVVPNHMLEQFANEFMELYPLANIMVADDQNFSKERRKAFVAAATLNAPDAIVITHDAYQRIGVKEESVAPIRDEILDDLRDELDEAAKDKGARVRRGQLEQQIEAVTQRFDSIVAAGKKDGIVTFEEMGVDYVFADEAHVFRKLDFHTAQQIKGIDPNGSRRALDMYVKTRWLDKQRPGRAFTFASGTPVTNTMGELFTILRFFAPDVLNKGGISTFDAWSRMFGEVVPALEPNASGKYEIVERFAKFDNVPELMARVRQFMDVLQSDQLGAVVKRPDLEGGKPDLIVVEPTKALKEYQEGPLSRRLEISRQWKPSFDQPNNPDPVIAIIGDGRFAATDPRFIPGGKVQPGETTKMDRAAQEIAAEYKATAGNEYLDRDKKPTATKGGTQIVFYNVGFGKDASIKRGFDSRGTFTKTLVGLGVKRDHIAWFDDADTDAKKEAIFKAMRAGSIRVLIGSAKKMGTGVNVQNRLTALHYMDPPWFPADVEQPHGRIIRQGNQNPRVRIKWYAAKGGYDSTMWQMVGRKQRFIDQAFSGDKNLRSMDDLGEASLYEQAAAAASGDPRALQLAGLRQDVERLERLQAAHSSEQINARSARDSAEWEVQAAISRIATFKKALAAIGGGYFTFTDGKIGGKTFTKHGEFGDALKAAFNKAAADKVLAPSEDSTTIGTIGKLPVNVTQVWERVYNKKLGAHENVATGYHDLSISADGFDIDVARSAGLTDEVDGTGLTRRMVNAINEIDRKLREAEARKTDAETNIARLRKKIGAPFEYQQQMLEKYAELKELEATLKAEGEAARAEAAAAVRADQQAASAKNGDPEDGPPPMLSRSRSRGAGRLNLASAQSLAAELAAGGLVRLNVVQSVSDLPARQRKQVLARDPEGQARGAYFRGSDQVWIVADNIQGADEFVEVALHESFHRGLAKTIPEAGAVLQEMWRTNQTLRAATAEQMRRHGIDRAEAIEEALADMASAGKVRDLKGWAKLLDLVRGFLSKIARAAGVQMTWTDDMVADFVAGITRAGLEGGMHLDIGAASPALDRGVSAFDRWFGDSKIVDKDGKPLVMYHGTSESFDRFQVNNDRLIFVTPDPKFADGFTGLTGAVAGGNIMPLYVKASNPFDPGKAAHRQDVIGRLMDKMPTYRMGDGQKALLVDGRKSLYTEEVLTESFKADESNWLFLEQEWLLDAIKRAGYDAIYVMEEGVKNLAVFDPKQIKSATGNRGTYDPADDDVRMSRAAATVVQNAHDLLTTQRSFNWWHRTVGTQFHKAQTNPAFKAVYDKAQEYLHDTSAFANDAADRAPDLLPQLKELRDVGKALGLKKADRERLAAAVFEGTLMYRRDDSGQAVEADGEQTAGVIWTPAELKERYGFTDGQVKLYQQFRASTDRSLDTLVAADVARLLGDLLPNAMKAMISEGDLGRFRGIVTAFLGQQRAAAEKALADMRRRHRNEMSRHWAKQKALLEGPAGRAGTRLATMRDLDEKKNAIKLRQGGEKYRAEQDLKRWDELDRTTRDKYDRIDELKAKGYAPLMRFGRYTVDVVGDDGSRLYFSLYESQREANAAARRLAGEFEGATVTQGLLSEEAYKQFSGMTPETLELFAELAGVEKTSLFEEYIRRAKNNRSAMKRLIKRQGIAGYSEDASRVLASFITSNARAASSNLHIGDMGEAVEAIPKEMGDVKDEAIKLREYVQNPVEEAQALRGLLFVQYLGGSVASAMVNLTQPLMMTFPYLSQFGGPAKAARRLAGAMKAALGSYDKDSELGRALRQAERDGVVSPQELHQLQAEAGGQYAGSRLLGRFKFLWGSLFSAAEQFNRRVSFVAAYQTALEQQMPNPFRFAEQAVDQTQGVYNKGNRPNWARGAVGSTVFTFKQYSISYVEFLKRLPKRERVLALAILVLAAGANGLPGADDLDDLIDTLGQHLGYDTNAKLWKTRVLNDALGETAADFALHGFSALPGIPLDVAGRLGLGNLIPGTGLLRKDTADKSREVAEAIGPAGSTITNAVKAVPSLLSGDLMQAHNLTGATATKNLAKAVEMYQTGEYRDTKGRKVMDVDGGDALTKAIGFQPQAVAKDSRQAGMIQQQVALARTVESEIADAIARARVNGKPEDERKARERLAEWNRENPESRIGITAAQIVRRVREMRLSRDDRMMKSAPRELRAGVAEGVR